MFVNLNQLNLKNFETYLNPNCACSKVKMKHLATKELINLQLNRWLAIDEDDYDLCREIAISHAGKRPLPGSET
jgi:hypothetical protein